MIAPIDVTSIRIETPRLILRPWRESDPQDFYEYASVDGVGQMAGWLPHKTIERTKTLLESLIREKENLAMELKETGRVIGSIGVETRDIPLGIPEHLQGREIGFDMNKDYWGRGLMPEAVQGLLAYCFQSINYDYLTCGHFAWNTQCQRVMEKCGFQFLMEIPDETNFGKPEITRLYIRYRPSEEDGL